jgi:hypothetical protein
MFTLGLVLIIIGQLPLARGFIGQVYNHQEKNRKASLIQILVGITLIAIGFLVK